MSAKIRLAIRAAIFDADDNVVKRGFLTEPDTGWHSVPDVPFVGDMVAVAYIDGKGLFAPVLARHWLARGNADVILVVSPDLLPEKVRLTDTAPPTRLSTYLVLGLGWVGPTEQPGDVVTP